MGLRTQNINAGVDKLKNIAKILAVAFRYCLFTPSKAKCAFCPKRVFLLKMNIKPLAGYVLIEPAPKETKTASGIVLPESADEKPQEGKVIAVGDELVEDGKIIKCPVSVGDKVVYKKWGGNEIKVEGRELLLIKFEDLMAIVGK